MSVVESYFDQARARMCYAFPDGDVSEVLWEKYPQDAGVRYTFTVDLGYPEPVVVHMIVTREDARRTKSPDQLAMLYRNRIERALAELGRQTNRKV
jgi:hypothetical protein